MPAPKAAPKTTEHFFVVASNGTSAHRHGPFESRDAAISWVKAHYAGRQCWLIPAEYIGTVAATPLDEDGLRADDPRKRL